MDIDLLGRTDNAIDSIVQLMREVVQLDIPDEGLLFVTASFSGTAIREDPGYSGVRVALWDC